jgi:hypothetical protein
MQLLYKVAVIARFLNLTERRVQQLARDGIIPKPEKGKYDLVGCVQGYIGYLITQPSGLTANITKANVTVTADNTSKNQGAANPALTATLTGFVGGEVLGTSGITGSAGLSTTANSSSDIGTYVITSALGSLAASNYNFATFVNGLLTVNAVASTPRRLNPARIFPIRSYA